MKELVSGLVDLAALFVAAIVLLVFAGWFTGYVAYAPLRGKSAEGFGLARGQFPQPPPQSRQEIVPDHSAILPDHTASRPEKPKPWPKKRQ